MRYRLKPYGTHWVSYWNSPPATSNWLQGWPECMAYVELACLGLEYNMANVIDHEIYKNWLKP